MTSGVYGHPWWLSGKESACNVEDIGSIHRSVRSLGKGNGYPLQYSCLENPLDRGTWWATGHGVTKSWTRLKRLNTHGIENNLNLGVVCYSVIINPSRNYHLPQRPSSLCFNVGTTLQLDLSSRAPHGIRLRLGLHLTSHPC